MPGRNVIAHFMGRTRNLFGYVPQIKKGWQLADKTFHDRVGTGMPRSSHCLSRGSARTDLVRESGVREVLVNWSAYHLGEWGAVRND
ncbi:hypothetical protein BCON_0072g00420 [Botryotinia convoluta]|uniref:Uncharacterized protein n=1 Tax=Botryotinia convoluta TaxID=54673 RepID=A0A4Z1I608_9HELO|nr:hypothetical protein BCON_0072g00420 [Botryotinia convoluta]